MMFHKLTLSLWYVGCIVVISVAIGVFLGVYIENYKYSSEANVQPLTTIYSTKYTQPVYKPLVGWKGFELESDTSLMDKKYSKPYALHRRGSEVATIGDHYIYYLAYCGSGCQRFIVVNIANGKAVEGVLSYMNYGEDPHEWYVFFDDWHGDTHRFDGEIEKIIPSLKEQEITFLVQMKEAQGKSSKEYTVRYSQIDLE